MQGSGFDWTIVVYR